MIHPILSATYPLEGAGEAAWQVHTNAHVGKLGILCLAPSEGLGVQDPERRELFAGRLAPWRKLA